MHCTYRCTGSYLLARVVFVRYARGMSDASIYRFDIESFRIGRVNIDFFAFSDILSCPIFVLESRFYIPRQ